MFYNKSADNWVIQSLVDPSMYMTSKDVPSNELPIGTYSWKSENKGALCGKPYGTITKLTLSTCYPNKYSCDSGHCIGSSVTNLMI